MIEKQLFTETFFINGFEEVLNKIYKEEYSKKQNLIHDINFENIFLNGYFINNLSLFKDLMQTNKLAMSIWKPIYEIIEKNIHDIKEIFKNEINILNENITNKINENKKILNNIDNIKSEIEAIKNNNAIFEKVDINYLKTYKDGINNSNTKSKDNENEDNEENYITPDDFIKNMLIEENKEIIDKVNAKNKLIEDNKSQINNNEINIKETKELINLSDFNLLRIDFIMSALNLIINEERGNLLSLSNKTEKIKNFDDLLNKIYNHENYNNKEKLINFFKSFLVQLIKIINITFRDLNIDFLKYLVVVLQEYPDNNENNKKYITSFNDYLNRIILNPKLFLYPSAFHLMEKANQNAVQKFARSRGQSFDKADNTNNNYNSILDNKKNQKIDKFFKKENNKVETPKLAKSGEDINTHSNSNPGKNNINNNIKKNVNNVNNVNMKPKENNTKPISSYFQNIGQKSSLNQNNFDYLNFSKKRSQNSFLYQSSNNFSQMSFGRNPNNNSFASSSSRLSFDESESMYGLVKSDKSEYESLSNIYSKGINSRLSSAMTPFVETTNNITKKQNKVNDLRNKFRLDLKNKSADKKENESEIKRKKLSNLISNKFYENDIENKKTLDKTKTRKSTNNNANNRKKNNLENSNDVLIYKTPEKNQNDSNTYLNQNLLKENLNSNDVKRNLGFLFVQQLENK